MKGYFINAETRRNYECEYIYEFEYWRFTIARNQADYDVAVKGYVAPNGCHGIFSASYYFTVILQLTVVPSSFTLIVAVPFLRAEITPFLVTDATEELLLE